MASIVKNNLKALGIDHHTLFPDLDSLSKSIIDDHFATEYTPQVPPVCDGEYEP